MEKQITFFSRSRIYSASKKAKLIMLCAFLFLAPLTIMGQDNTIYIVDEDDNGTDRFLWSQFADAIAALDDGATLDLSDASPNPAQLNMTLTDKSVTVKGDPDKTYLLSIATNANLALEDFNSLVTSGLAPNLNLNPAGETSVLTVTGDCSLVNTVVGGGGDSRGARAIEAYKNLTIDGDGTLLASGRTNGIELHANNVVVTINATVTALHSSTDANGSFSSRECGILVRGAVSTFTGTGSLTVIASFNQTTIFYFDAIPTVSVTFSKLSHLSTGGDNCGVGLGLGRWDNASCTAFSITFDLPNPTTIEGKQPVGGALGGTAAANCVTTITNLGAEVNFIAPATSTYCSSIPGDLIFNGTGAFNFTGGVNGIRVISNLNITLNGSVAVSAQQSGSGRAVAFAGTGRVIFGNNAPVLKIANGSATDEITPLTASATGANWNLVNASFSTGTATDANVSVRTAAGAASVISRSSIVPVTDITGVPATATEKVPLTLTGTVVPADATNQTIVWSVKTAGTTGASISGNTLNTTAAGTVVVTATIADGAATGAAFTKDFTITVEAAFVPVTDITGVPATVTEKVPLTLTGTVVPADASNQTIVWNVKTAGTTGASISGNTLNTTAAGTVVVTATIAGGAATGTAFTKDFTIAVVEDVDMVPFSQIVLIRWNNTLTVINNSSLNGGYTFVSYQWFRNGQSAGTEQSWTAGDDGDRINPADRFYVVAVTTNNRTVRTTESAITLKSAELKAYPNPVATGQTLHLELNIDGEMLIEVYNMNGRLVDAWHAASLREIPIDGKYSAGMYVFVITGKDGFRQEIKVTIEN